MGIPEMLCGRGWGRGGASVAKFLLEWLKCGMMSRKEMLDGCDWKQTPKTECEALMLTHEESFRSATWGCSFQGTSWEFSETQQDIPHGPEPFISYTNSSGLYSTLKENSFLFPSERTVVFPLWYAQAWYLIGYLRNSFAERSSNVYLWWCLWQWHKLEWFHSFLCSFLHSLVPCWK